MFNFLKEKTSTPSRQWIFGVLLAFGIVGLIASFVLAVEEFHLLKNPNAVLSCSINAALNCSAVMQTWQASVFGFPNMFLGLMGFPAVIAVAVIGLIGVSMPRWFWRTANVAILLGAVFAYWLFFNSIYVIEVLCPWCLVITFSMTLLLSAITRYNLQENLLGVSKKGNKIVQAFIVKDGDKVITASWIVLLAALIFLKFGDSLFA